MTPTPREQAQRLLNQAAMHGNQNERGEWLTYANQAVLADPTYVDAWLMRGQARQEIGDMPGALSDYEHAIRLSPHYAPAYYKRAWYKGAVGDYLGAIEDSERAYQLEPGSILNYSLRLGHAYAELGDHQRALDYYQAALALHPTHNGVLYNRAILYYQRGEYALSLADLAICLHDQPQWAWAHEYCGANYLALGEYTKAIASLTLALRYEPTHARTYYLRSRAYQAIGDHKRADDDHRVAAELDPKQYGS